MAKLRNGADGYGLVTKTLHWTVATAVALQFAVGLAMDADDSGRSRGRGRSEESGRGRGGDSGYDVLGDDWLVTAHVALGGTILLLATIRLVWRLTTPLPPWAPGLSPAGRRFTTWTERVLYLWLFVVPASGLLLVFSGDDDLLPLHIAAQIGFLVTIAAHVGFALVHQFVLRDGLLRRML